MIQLIRASYKGYDSIRKIAGQQTKSKNNLEQILHFDAYLVSLVHLSLYSVHDIPATNHISEFKDMSFLKKKNRYFQLKD